MPGEEPVKDPETDECFEGLSFILGIPEVPYQVAQWRREHPGEDIPTSTCSSSPGPPGRHRNAATR